MTSRSSQPDLFELSIKTGQDQYAPVPLAPMDFRYGLITDLFSTAQDFQIGSEAAVLTTPETGLNYLRKQKSLVRTACSCCALNPQGKFQNW